MNSRAISTVCKGAPHTPFKTVYPRRESFASASGRTRAFCTEQAKFTLISRQGRQGRNFICDAGKEENSLSEEDAWKQRFAEQANDVLGNVRDDDGPGNIMEDLELNEDGDLVDTSTGKVLNEFGATRFDVAVRAMRGEMGPPPGVESTEKQVGQMAESLIRFPAPYVFQVVGKPGEDKEGFIKDMVQCIERVCKVTLCENDYTVKERGKGGKFVSLGITATVSGAETIAQAFEEVAKDSRVLFKY
ncbi:hypothetical protein CYMTET_19647 [Cymbomonas tetramitiformis]|uniref:Uncharacterized protein n=1 Tax=Cymbomonas tetramitiformis TaxID=36881 RepID=A0AAE0G654_9CHLO|nr:hypothetical protein CYMTET_19647 [Cymbomonas tetramitiformis]